MELEEALVRALRPLPLGSVPESAISSLFDTGGTASVREEWSDGVTRRHLRALDKVFGKYLRCQSTDEHLAHFWHFLASQEAIDAVYPSQESSENQDVVYRSLFALLQAIINVRDVYGTMNDRDKCKALVKALVAAKIYLAWLQLPGGSAYSLFMAYVYRQVLDLLKKWVLLLETMTSNSQDRLSTPSRRRKRPQIATVSSSDDTRIQESYEKLTTDGLALIDMLVLFLTRFSLSSSTESLVPTIEMIIALQTAIRVDKAATVTTKTLQILDALVSGVHGDILPIGRVILHCYLPGVTFQETMAKENQTSLRFHRLAMTIVTRMQARLLTPQDDCEEDERIRHEYSLLVLGLIQNICLYAPGVADERQRVVLFVLALVRAGRHETNEFTPINCAFRDEEYGRLCRFLASYSRTKKLKYRQFGVEVLSRMVLETKLWHGNDIPEELVSTAGIGPVIEVLIDRASDKISQVRTKAIVGISTMLSLGLSTLARGNENHDSDAIATSLQKLLYDSSMDQEQKSVVYSETPLLSRLVTLFRERLEDDKAYVRKAAVHALEALLTAQNGETLNALSRHDLFEIHARCTDASLIVRIQAIKSLSALVLKFPREKDAQTVWNLGVLPLCFDPETNVQSCALEAVGTVVFDRVVAWYNVREKERMREALDCVWMQVAYLDGVMARCVQKALRLLMKNNKLHVETILQTCVYAIQESVRPYHSVAVHDDVEEETACRVLTRYWGFSWMILEELAHSGDLVKKVQNEPQHLCIVIECWHKLQTQVLPFAFHDGSKRILRVLAALSTVIDARDAKSIATGILASLESFAIPLNVISDGIVALHSLCKAKTPVDQRQDMTFQWGQQFLGLCETNLRKWLESSVETLDDVTALVQKQLISIGAVAVLEFHQDADKSAEAALVPLRTTLPSLVQLFLPPQFLRNRLIITSPATQDMSSSSIQSESVPLPTPIRVCAFVTLGKLCLRDKELAKTCMTMFIRELRTCKEHEIRSNIVLILGDLCIRYTSLVDAYLPTMALSLLDASRLVRRNTLLLLSQLILQDYIKWRDSLLRYFLRAVVDEDDELAHLARHVLCGPLMQKCPHLFTQKFIEMIFVFNGVVSDKISCRNAYEEEGTRQLALQGERLYARRARLYRFLLHHMSDEQKLQICMKLCSEVLEEVMEGTLPLCANPSEITDHGTEAVLKDTFAILCCPEIKLTSFKDDDDDELDREDIGLEEHASVATQLAVAKGKLLSKLSKKTFLENVVPVLIGLKHTLEAKHSPLVRSLLYYIQQLFQVYRHEVKDIFTSTDPQMAMEVEYDLRQLHLHQEQSRRKENAQEEGLLGVFSKQGMTPRRNEKEIVNSNSLTREVPMSLVDSSTHWQHEVLQDENDNGMEKNKATSEDEMNVPFGINVTRRKKRKDRATKEKGMEREVLPVKNNALEIQNNTRHSFKKGKKTTFERISSPRLQRKR